MFLEWKDQCCQNLYTIKGNLFKKIRDTKGTFHEKMGTIKDRNGMDLIEAEEIKRQQEYTEELNEKDLYDPDKNDGVITHLGSEILEYKVTWPLENKRMGKTRDLFKKIRDTKGNISCKDGHNKGQKWYGPNRSRRY